jgi:uncharacterized protein YndB with AHSA1/START domain
MSDRFVYVTYIRTTPDALWAALTGPDFMRRYWWGTVIECRWETGAPWRMIRADGTVTDGGTVVESDPPRRLVLSWRHEWRPELAAEGEARATFTIEPAGATTKLTVLHEIAHEKSALIGAVSGGWPMILASLKTLLETGTAMPDPRQAA